MNQADRGEPEIQALLARRAEQYTYAVVRTALALERREGEWKNCVTTVQLSEGDAPDSRSLIFDGFEIHELVTKPEAIRELIDHLVSEGKLNVADRIISLKDGRFDKLGHGQREGVRVASGEGWIPSEWPCDHYLFAARREINPPSGSLITPSLPAYPNAFEAIEHVLRIDSRGGRTWDGGVFFVFPDFRARIATVTLGTESLSVRIEHKRAEPDQLLGKVHAKSRGGSVYQQDVEFGTSEEKVSLPFQPEHAYVGLVHKATGELLDQWEHTPFRPSTKLTVEAFTPQYVEQLIGQGENSFVEYKPGVRDENVKREIAKSAIAFANKNGGVIIIGVDDNARVQGAFGDGWAEVIAQCLRDRTEPPIEPLTHRVVVEDKQLFVVLIGESNNKPHLLKESGVVYVRISSTDKPVTRYELDELYEKRRQGPGGLVFNPF